MNHTEFKTKFMGHWMAATGDEETFDILYEMMASFFDGKGAPPLGTGKQAQLVLDAYYKAYEKRYGFKLTVTPMIMKHCKQLVSKCGAEVAVAVVQEYLASNDRWYLDKRHDLMWCVRSSDELALRAEARKQGMKGPTRAEVKTRSVLSDNIDTMEAYLDGQTELP